jgi:hypothetical protein
MVDTFCTVHGLQEKPTARRAPHARGTLTTGALLSLRSGTLKSAQLAELNAIVRRSAPCASNLAGRLMGGRPGAEPLTTAQAKTATDLRAAIPSPGQQVRVDAVRPPERPCCQWTKKTLSTDLSADVCDRSAASCAHAHDAAQRARELCSDGIPGGETVGGGTSSTCLC